MKNILVIDGAENCTYEIYGATDDEFLEIFGSNEVLFIEDILSRADQENLDLIFSRIWERRIEKKRVSGIHGTLFYEQYYKKKYFSDGSWDSGMNRSLKE